MATIEEIRQARELVETYEKYVTHERFMKVLKRIDAGAYEDAMCAAVQHVKTSSPDVLEKVEHQLINDAVEDKEYKARRAAKARQRRARMKAQSAQSDDNDNEQSHKSKKSKKHNK